MAPPERRGDWTADLDRFMSENSSSRRDSQHSSRPPRSERSRRPERPPRPSRREQQRSEGSSNYLPVRYEAPHHEQQAAPQVIVVQAERRRSMGFMGFVGCSVLGLGALGVGAGLLNHYMQLWDWPHFGFPNNETPGSADAVVNQDSYEVAVDIDMHCSKIVSASVDVEAHVHQNTGPIQTASGNFDKQVFGDFMLCSDDDEIDANARAASDPITGLQSLVVNLSGVQVVQPRVDFADPRNCIDGNRGDSMEEINQKLAEYNAAVANGDRPECDDGFDISGQFSLDTNSLSKVITLAQLAAQLGLTLDANPREIIEQANTQLETEVHDQLAARSEFAGYNITVNVNPEDDTTTVQQRFDAIAADLGTRFPVREMRTDDDGQYLYLEDSHGENVSIHFTGYAALEANELQLTNVDIHPNPDYNPAATTTLASN